MGRYWPSVAVLGAGIVGLGLLIDGVGRSSATYDEGAYLEVAARWWRGGEQEAITRMGSPLTFWKLQQAPVLWWLDRTGRGAWIDDPIAHQARLLPMVRLGSLWIWAVALGLTAWWCRALYGPRAMAFGAWLFALSPNVLAHAGLATMELPLLASTTGMFVLFWRFLTTGRRAWFWGCAALGGLALSCKFTTVVVPPLLALVWWVEDRGRWREIVGSMIGFLGVMVVSNLIVTGFAVLPLSGRVGQPHPALDGREWMSRFVETPIPRDWVGFATQMRHQRSGGPSYLLGERRLTGWRHYYFVALAVKVPLTFWLLVLGRAVLGRSGRDEGQGPHVAAAVPAAGQCGRDGRPTFEEGSGRDGRRHTRKGEGLVLVVMTGFLAITAVGSTRNYGLRYLLPLAPLAIVWVSALAEGGRWARGLMWVGLAGQAVALGSIHPHELTYFNALAGGPVGGRRILADSNLDWGQGARSLARLQRERPELRNLTTYAFGDTDPGHYGVVGTRYVIDAGGEQPGLPARFGPKTRYVAVSASLQWGPWGPAGYFRALDGVRPVAWTDDTTIAVYLTADIEP